ncbi:MAG: type I restriction-modification enzyme R subunit C-terminal domain-containing protein [Bacteroidales bacterium]
MSMIIDFLTTNGVVDPEMLYSPPFTQLHFEGVSGVFNEAEAERIIKIIAEINHNAVA